MNIELRKKALEMNRNPVERKTFLIADTRPARPLTPPAITRLEDVKCPALIIAGSLENSEVLRAAKEMSTRIPGAKQIIMEGCAHVPAYEKPEVFLSHLMSFLG
jgi:pimeloyl-ACP methyl ester carboxylesterase